MIPDVIAGLFALAAAVVVGTALPGVVHDHRRDRARARFLREHPDFPDDVAKAAREFGMVLARFGVAAAVAAEQFRAFGAAVREAEAAQVSLAAAYADANAAARSLIKEQQ